MEETCEPVHVRHVTRRSGNHGGAGLVSAPPAIGATGPVGIAASGSVALPTAGVLGIGAHVYTSRNTGIYSGPGLSTPRIGTAWAGDNVESAWIS